MGGGEEISDKRSVFCSYSGADRERVRGLVSLLNALGHDVFMDHNTIKPGARWQASLQEGLDHAQVLLVYWTRSASRSEWVRNEIEYFHVHYPHRLLVPVLGDETPLSKLLEPYQHSDFCPLINELLDLKRTMVRQGAKPAQVQAAILGRLREAGVQIEEKDRKSLYRLFAGAGLLGLLAAPLLILQSTAGRAIEALAQLSRAQAASLGVAAITGGLLYSVGGDTSQHRNAGPCDVVGNHQNPESQAADTWLGLWTLTDTVDGDRHKQDTFLIIRECDTYRVQGKGADILQISRDRLRLVEGGNEMEISMQGSGVAEVSSTARTTSVPAPAKLFFIKVAGYAPVIRPCVAD